ncbi:MAG: hypothetical protein QM704_22970 [Anaeromyxobacteraceae bacterium]
MMQLETIQSIDAELQALASKEGNGLVVFLRRLDGFDRAMGYAVFNCPSLFEYLVRRLHFAEGTAFRRITAMRLLRRYPQVADALEARLVNATQLGILAAVIADDNVSELIRKATHLTKRKTEELVVSIRPRDVAAPGLRKAPPTGVSLTEVVGAPEVAQTSAGSSAMAAHAPEVAPPVMPRSPEGTAPASLALPVAAPFRAPRRSPLEPVAAGRWHWRVELDAEQKGRLDTLKGYLSHKFPSGDLTKVFDQMLADSLEKHGKRLGFVKPGRARKPAPAKAPTPGLRQRIPLPVRRAVLERDGHRCTELAPDGERCPETERLEMDHLNPAKETGSSTVDDLVTKCRTHNQYRAYLRYGTAHMRRCIDDGRRERKERRLERDLETALAGPPPLLAKEPAEPWPQRSPAPRPAALPHHRWRPRPCAPGEARLDVLGVVVHRHRRLRERGAVLEHVHVERAEQPAVHLTHGGHEHAAA